MRAAFCILFLAALSLNAQVTKDVRAFNVSGIIQEPIMFFRTNIYAGANISITHSANGTIIINGGAGGGTNAIVLTNGVLVGSIGTLNFVSGVTGYVSGAEVRLGVNVVGGSGSSITVSSNYIITTPVITNLNFVMGTNIFIVVTNTSGDASVWINVDKFGITNGLATISYVDSRGLTTNANQFLGVPLSIRDSASVTNLSNFVALVNDGHIYVRSNSYVTQTNLVKSLYVTNESFLGSPNSGHFTYAYDIPGAQYRSILQGGSANLIWGTNAHVHNWLGTSFRPFADSGVPFGGSANRWSEGWFAGLLFVSNALRAGSISVSNIPGTQLGFIELRSTNGQAYTRFSRLDDNWKPTNYFKFSITNPVADQILVMNPVSYTAGEASIVLTNRVLEWLNYSTNTIADTATNRTKYLSNIWGDVARVLVPADGEVLKYDSAMGRWTNKTDTGGSGTPGGGSGNVQFNEGGVFAGTNRLMYDRVNNRLISSNNNYDASIAVTSPNLVNSNYMYADGMSTPVDYYNIHLFDSGAHAISANYWRFSSTNLFYNPGSNTVDLGLHDHPWKTNYTKWYRAYDGIQITSESAGTNSITFIITNAVRVTNVLAFSLTNMTAGQVFKIHNVQTVAGHVISTITNDTDNTGGGGGGAFNMNQFSASTLTNLKQFLLITNPIVYSTNVQSTNLVIQLLSSPSGAALSILNSAGAMITEVNSNGFFMQTNSLTNYTRGTTLPTPTNTIAIGVENYAGRIMPTWFDDKALQFSVQPFLGNNRVFMILTSAGTAAGVFGVTTAVPAGGTTISHPAPTFTQPYMVSIATGTTSNNCAAIMSSVDLASAGNHNGSGDPRGFGVKAGYFFAIEWSNTNNISGIVNNLTTRTFTGLTALANTTATNLVVTTNATGQYIGLYSDPRESLNMYISARDASAEFRTNTGINFVATNIYQFYLMNTHTSRFAHWKLKDLTARTEAYGWFSNNVPTNFMKMIIATKNGTNRAHSVKFSKMYLETPLTPQ